MKKPLAIDLCCGNGGWGEGLIREGWTYVGFDIVLPTLFPNGGYFVKQDVMTLSGYQFREKASFFVASPPCTEFTQCWNFARHRTANPENAMHLVRRCFQIAQEAGAPIVLENVMGARKFFEPEFGPPAFHIGPYYFWGESLILRPQGRFRKGIWNTGKDKTGARRWQRDNRAATYVRDPRARARIPLEISAAVGSQLYPVNHGAR